MPFFKTKGFVVIAFTASTEKPGERLNDSTGQFEQQDMSSNMHYIIAVLREGMINMKHENT